VPRLVVGNAIPGDLDGVGFVGSNASRPVENEVDPVPIDLKNLSVCPGPSPTAASRALDGYADLGEKPRRCVVGMDERSSCSTPPVSICRSSAWRASR
jgi:hypothetical protein